MTVDPRGSGSDLIELDNGLVRVTVDPFVGGQITRFQPADAANAIAHYDWLAPLPVGRGPGLGSTEADWLSVYRGGWQTLFPNAGAECIVDGVRIAFHGDASLAQTEVLSVSATECVLRVACALPLVLTRHIWLEPGQATLRIEEQIENVGTHKVNFLLGHHPTFTAAAGARIDVPASIVHVEPATPGTLSVGTGRWPLIKRQDSQMEDLSVIPSEDQVRLVYLESLASGWVALHPPRESDLPAVGLAWDLETFPHLWMWLQNGDNAYPWWGRARLVGLEPQRSWPFDGLAAARDRGQALSLEPGDRHSTWITLTQIEHARETVTSIERSGKVSHELSAGA